MTHDLLLSAHGLRPPTLASHLKAALSAATRRCNPPFPSTLRSACEIHAPVSCMTHDLLLSALCLWPPTPAIRLKAALSAATRRCNPPFPSTLRSACEIHAPVSCMTHDLLLSALCLWPPTPAIRLSAALSAATRRCTPHLPSTRRSCFEFPAPVSCMTHHLLLSAHDLWLSTLARRLSAALSAATRRCNPPLPNTL